MAEHPNLRHRSRFAPSKEKAFCERCGRPRLHAGWAKGRCPGWTLPRSARRGLFGRG